MSHATVIVDISGIDPLKSRLLSRYNFSIILSEAKVLGIVPSAQVTKKYVDACTAQALISGGYSSVRNAWRYVQQNDNDDQ